jgi:VWFA-related protein
MVSLLAAAALSGSVAVAQSSRPTLTSTATAVLVDVVVRNHKNEPVVDLNRWDFEISEDGVPQRLDSFTRISHGGGIGIGVAWDASHRATSVTSPQRPEPQHANASAAENDGTTALVFDHLSSESLRLAQRATLKYVPSDGESGTRVGVFSVDGSVRLQGSFTTERARIREAVERLMPYGSSVEEQKAERADDLIARRRELQGQTESATATLAMGASAAAQNAGDIGQRENELRMLQTELNMLRSFDSFDRANKGYDTSLTLTSIVRLLAEYPGRKTIVFFSEGLPVSPALSAKLDSMIDAANRSNVSVYVVDANGLRTKSVLENTRKEMEVFGDERLQQLASGTNRTDEPISMAFERVEDRLRLDSRTGLARLAEQTGGFLIEGSNDLSSAFRRIDEDNQFHYLLSYSPRNSTFDGKYRAIQVKVHRSGVEVFARKGYRALGSLRSSDTGAYEAPAVALLDRTPLPNAFPVHAGAFSFPEASRPGLTPVVVHVATDAFRYNVDSQRSTYSGQAAIVVRIRDGDGREVQKLSQQYLLSGDAKDLGAARHGDIIFYREVDLPPGLYTMETIVFDAASRQGSARVGTLNVARDDSSGLRMSSLVLVNRAEEIKDASADRGPLYVGQTLLYPSLGEPITKSNTSELPFYFALYGDVSGARAVAQLLRNGRAVAEAPVELPPATASRVQQVSRLPIATMPAGTYELRIRVMHKGQELSRSAFFTLQD